MSTRKKVSTPDIKSVDDIPGSIFDPDVVRASAIHQLQEMEDRHNFNRQQRYLLAVANWERNFFEKGKRFPLPQPVLMLHYRYVVEEAPKQDWTEVTEGPEFVAEPYTPPVKPTLPAGMVGFGLPAEDGIGSFWVGPTNTVQPGTHAVKDGKEYVFVVIGRLGTLVYRKMWIPIES